MVQPTYSLDNGPSFNIGPSNELLVPGDILQGTQFRQLGPMTPHCVSFHDDFLGSALAIAPYTLKKGSDASAANPAIVASAMNGAVKLTTGANASADNAGNGSQLLMGLSIKHSNGATVLEGAIGNMAAAIANSVVFFGWTDQIAAVEMPGTISGTTLTAVADDFVGFLYDTAATSAFFQASAAKATVVKTLTASAVAPSITETYNRFRIEVSAAGDATLYIDGVLLATITSAITPTVLMTPTFACFSRAATSKTIQMDYIAMRQARQY
jgi:hypothetical protein